MPSPRYFDRSLLYGMIKQGIGLFVINTAAMSIFQVDKLIIGKMLGQDAVADYSVVGRPFMLVFGLYSLLLAPLWPVHGEALRRGDTEWVRRMLRLSVLAGCGGVIACGVAMFFFGDKILTVWTRGQMVEVSRPLVVAMTALFVLWTWMASLSILLNSAGVLRAQMWFISAHALLNLMLAFALAKPYRRDGRGVVDDDHGIVDQRVGLSVDAAKVHLPAQVDGLDGMSGVSTASVECPVCRSRDIAIVGRPRHRQPTKVAGTPIDLSDLDLTWRRCGACGYQFIYPVIPEARLLACYAAAATGHWATANADYGTVRFYEQKKRLLETFSPGKRLLDFGCFDGGFLSYVGAGYETFGIEPAADAARVAASRGVTIIGPTAAAAAAADARAKGRAISTRSSPSTSSSTSTTRSPRCATCSSSSSRAGSSSSRPATRTRRPGGGSARATRTARSSITSGCSIAARSRNWGGRRECRWSAFRRPNITKRPRGSG